MQPTGNTIPQMHHFSDSNAPFPFFADVKTGLLSVSVWALAPYRTPTRPPPGFRTGLTTTLIRAIVYVDVLGV